MAISKIKNTGLENSTITINGSQVSMGGSTTISAGTDWQSVITADGSTFNTAVAGEGYFIDTTSAAHTITLPASPSAGDEVTIVDYAGTFGTNAVTVGRNGSNVDGSANNPTLSTNRENVRFVYMDSTQGWRSIFDGASTTYGTSFLSATGGTVTTSGDYKIHTFTGDGCFVVSQVGTGGAPSVVDYLVVAGGASGGGDRGGGGGAGGLRYFADPSTNPQSGNPGSPLNAPAGITVTAQTYPISVGAGGAGSSSGQQGNNGSNSSFSTITSAGGGFGGGCQGGTSTGANGGSGGGGRDAAWAGGNGNTPPVSPPQGQGGGTSPTSNNQAGGGGGAIGGGGGGAPGAGGGGHGAGLTGFGASNGECSSCVQYFSGGGSGGTNCGPARNGGLGGGGNSPTGVPGVGTAGTANTGGGSAGNNNNTNSGNAGGSGIVIIRYKYQ